MAGAGEVEEGEAGLIFMRIGEQKIEKLMRRKELDAILFWGFENIRYLCGFTGSDGALVWTRGERVFLTDSRYTEQAQSEVRNAGVSKYRQKIPGISRLLKTLRGRRIGFEAAAVSFENYRRLRETLPRVSFVPLSGEFSGLRAVKETEEIACLKRAVQIASESFEKTIPKVKPGSREAAVAEALECRFRRGGGEKPSFDTIVASGYRAALPHGAASEKKLAAGETVVVDFGTRFRGYHSDETKTLILGEPDGRVKKVYDVVRRAQAAAIRAVRPGVSGREIDAAARGVIQKAGLGKCFGHGTGHGVGLAVHEDPAISPRGTTVVEEGMVFTVEPGVYIPGWGGVRLEDMVRVTAAGCERLTYLSKDIKDNIM
jgi:Xaa-Pro aminopeptidase